MRIYLQEKSQHMDPNLIGDVEEERGSGGRVNTTQTPGDRVTETNLTLAQRCALLVQAAHLADAARNLGLADDQKQIGLRVGSFTFVQRWDLYREVAT